MGKIAEQIGKLYEKGLTEGAEALAEAQKSYSVFEGCTPSQSLQELITSYNWFSNNKKALGVTGNDLRNTVGALFEDFLTHLVLECTAPYPNLDVFVQARTSFGRYTLWQNGQVRVAQPGEVSDLAAGYRMTGETPTPTQAPWPKPIATLGPGQSILPVLIISSKVRVSQPEFFDWFGRAQLMAKGHPHCLSLQVGLRKEMDLEIVAAAQASNEWFLLGDGREGHVVPLQDGLDRLMERIREHLELRC